MNEQLSKRTAEADKRVGACVRAARVKAGLSQSKLAGELGITFQQLQKYEKGKNRIAVSTLLLIADALSLPVQSFFTSVERQAADASDWPDLLSKDNIRLIRAFSNIGDAEVRRRIMGLILAVTDETEDVGFLAEPGTLAQDSHAL
ncbi:helix-turn-helix domain-containing protein [Lichenibacterium ramalinae]|uniref:XRE family transcriptional regulator n=1 Tax=Lichenibacterium ramalinae TaxID=2316527 RepID=A0A4Q2RFD6_9HYPH|nr:helix-turn-helix transcriptional regulator [Lichenibacterium ramalinae]RYB05969.1 XRE family transcriptional regulator [Lichenibacterium ramalinae]